TVVRIHMQYQGPSSEAGKRSAEPEGRWRCCATRAVRIDTTLTILEGCWSHLVRAGSRQVIDVVAIVIENAFRPANGRLVRFRPWLRFKSSDFNNLPQN